MSDTAKKTHRSGKGYIPDWTGKTLSEAHRCSISEALKVAQKGEKNSQYGKVWIHKIEPLICIAIKKEELESYQSQGWIRGRKRK